MKRFYFLLLWLPVFIIFTIGVFYFFDFTAEDAYITYRYAENLVNIGSLVFNEGEPINAMTSPVHALLSSALYYITSHTTLSNKILALFLLLISAFLVAGRFKNHTELQLLVVSLTILPSCILLWTFGGLETPFLLFLVTVTVVMVHGRSDFSGKLLYAIFVLAGLGVLTRYDSVLFFAPLILYVSLKARSLKQVFIAIIAGSLLPVLWLSVSYFYYGDILPTSFYVKTPSVGFISFVFNSIYIFSYLFFVGIIPLLLFILLIQPGPKRRTNMKEILYRNASIMWWLYLAILLQLLYGFTMATKHMMFSFRYFVPYLPSTAILVTELLRHTVESNKAVNLHTGRVAAIFQVLLVCLWLFFGYQIIHTYNSSVNGLAFFGEYTQFGVRDYQKYSDTLRQHSEDIKKHWESVKGDTNRNPRIYTYAAGILPYSLRDSYIYEKLISYRHTNPKRWRVTRNRVKLSSDYICMIVPKNGTIDSQLPKTPKDYTLISSYEVDFNNSKQSFMVYYNPNPVEHTLQVKIK
ncbi:MAG TPA: hypothetical protein VJL89_11980 [Thermodesulfovibrionia bacterium]|nr:hypothetical protein [Thermodesulfovibrionia bacterium]